MNSELFATALFHKTEFQYEHWKKVTYHVTVKKSVNDIAEYDSAFFILEDDCEYVNQIIQEWNKQGYSGMYVYELKSIDSDRYTTEDIDMYIGEHGLYTATYTNAAAAIDVKIIRI